MTISEWDPGEHLESLEEIALYLNAALEQDSPMFWQVAFGDVAKAVGINVIAKEVGVGRESLYKSLSTEGNPL